MNVFKSALDENFGLVCMRGVIKGVIGGLNHVLGSVVVLLPSKKGGRGAGGRGSGGVEKGGVEQRGEAGAERGNQGKGVNGSKGRIFSNSRKTKHEEGLGCGGGWGFAEQGRW